MKFKGKLLSFLIPIFFIFMHFEIGLFFGFHLTIGAVVGIFVLLSISTFRISRNALYIFIALNVVLLITPILHPRYFNFFDFLTTALLVEYAFLVLVLSLGGTRVHNLGRLAAPGVRLSFWIVCSYSLAQFILATGFGTFFYNPWGERQFLYQYTPIPSAIGFVRSSGFYLEPSFNAFVICALTLLVVLLKSRPTLYLPVSLLSLLTSQSATGLIVWLALTTFVFLSSRRVRSLPFLLLVFLAITASYGYLAQRVGSIGQIGSSGNYRVLSPTEIMGDLLGSQFLGYPLGSLYTVVSQYQLFQFGSQQAITLDNGVYVVIFYFGWLGALALLFMVLWIFFQRNQEGNLIVNVKALRLWLLLALFFSGAIFAPEYVIVNFLVVVIWSVQKVENQL